jgi:hypothetical protein
MRARLLLFFALFGIGLPAFAQTPPTCTGLCLLQTTCPSGQTTSISGVVYAPNGTDPLPNVTVYVPNAPVDPFTPGVSCPVVGTPPSGSPLVGTISAVDGTFTIPNMPVGPNIPVVIVTGRWRVQTTVNTTACVNTPMPASQTHLPQNQSQGDIPKFAIVTGSADQVECVLLKVGISKSEFTDASGTGRINLFKGTGSPGAQIDSATPSASTLTGTSAALNAYDVLMLPCEGKAYTKPAADLADLITFANAGGRVYSSHYSYVWMYKNTPFDSVANWSGNSTNLPDGIATVDTTFADGVTLSAWLQEVGASTTPGQIAISTLRRDFSSINSPTQSYLRLNDAADNNPVMQFVFNTPVGNATNQCGRVLFNEYHVEEPPTETVPTGTIFPAECSVAAITPQEKLLEYSLFELTNNGNPATLTPTSQDFGNTALGFNSAPQTFTWTNNSTFGSSVTLLTATGDFAVKSNNCSSVPANSSCQIVVVFSPTVLGARTGVLTVGSTGGTLTATLTGTGVPAVTLNPTSLTFGSQDVGFSANQALLLTNNAPGSLTMPSIAVTGDYAAKSNCGTAIPAQSSCNITVTFTPTVAGSRPGALSFNTTSPAFNGIGATLAGTGIDFTVTASPTSGTVIAGYQKTVTLTTTPLGGFANPVTFSCSTNAPASTCTVVTSTFTPSVATAAAVTITTTSEYSVIGYSGGAAGGASRTAMLLWLLAVSSGGILFLRRRQTAGLLRWSLAVLMLGSFSLLLSGCSGKQPTKNAVYTPATTNGGYTYTLTETDGFLVHSATYTLAVTSN